MAGGNELRSWGVVETGKRTDALACSISAGDGERQGILRFVDPVDSRSKTN